MRSYVAAWLLALAVTVSSESIFDDDEAPPPAQEQDSSDPNELTFGFGANNEHRSLTDDIQFDGAGNVAEGGCTDPDISMWHITSFNGEIIDEPNDGAAKLKEALGSGQEYVVRFAPPNLAGFKCTEKVEGLQVLFERDYSHEINAELLERALATLAAEGVMNTKQLGELDEKDYDEIRLPALIKSKLRKIRAEASAQAAVAGKQVEMDSAEVEEELRKFMEDRAGAAGGEAPKAEAKAADAAAPADAEAPKGAEQEEEDGTFKSLVWAVMNCPTCKGKETIACFRTCRYGGGLLGEKKSWGDCLDKCIENRWLRLTFSAMLPRGS